MLTGNEIIKNVLFGNIRIDPFNINNVGPNSYDLQIDNKLLVYDCDKSILDSRRENNYKEIIMPDSGYVLEPGILYLGTTVEYTGSSHFVPILHGRSSIARLGIFTHFCAGFGDLSWYGQWTLEISVIHPVRIYPYTRVCQISFDTVVGMHTRYSGKYQDQKGPTSSKIWMDKLRSETSGIIPLLVSEEMKSQLLPICKKGTTKIAYVPWDKRYCISDFGDVISLTNKNKPFLLSVFYRKDSDYPHVQIIKNKVAVHRILAASFIGPPQNVDGSMQIVRHLDGDPNNCVLSNITYGSYQDNSNDMIIHGKTYKGKDNHQSKLTDDDVLEIRRIRYEQKIKISSLAKMYNVCDETIRRILHKITWTHLDDGLGVLCETKYGKHSKLDDNIKFEIDKLIVSGVKYDDIINKYGVSRRVVTDRANKLHKKNLL